MVDDAKKNNIPIIKGKILDIKLEDNSYECCLLIDVLEHINNIKTALQQIIRISKKYIIISFFRKPLNNNTTLEINKHINSGDKLVEETLNDSKLYLIENPSWRKGFTKGIYYNIHKKEYIEEIVNNLNCKLKWIDDKTDKRSIILFIEKL